MGVVLGVPTILSDADREALILQYEQIGYDLGDAAGFDRGVASVNPETIIADYISGHPPENLGCYALFNAGTIPINWDWYDVNDVLIPEASRTLDPGDYWSVRTTAKQPEWHSARCNFASARFYTRSARLPYDNTLSQFIGSAGAAQTSFTINLSDDNTVALLVVFNNY